MLITILVLFIISSLTYTTFSTINNEVINIVATPQTQTVTLLGGKNVPSIEGVP